MKEKQHLESSLFKRIEKLIEEGIEITHLSQENDVKNLPKNEELNFYVWDIKDRYIIWKLECNKMVEKIGHHNSIFAESNSVSLVSGAIAQTQISPTSIVGQKILISIRKETSKGLSFLRNMINDSHGIKIKNGKNIFNLKNSKNHLSFNKITGDLILNNITICFKPKTRKFRIMQALIEDENNLQADYATFFNLLNWDNKKTKRRDLQEIIKEMKEELKITPKNKKSNFNIFKNIKNFGYRLTIK